MADRAAAEEAEIMGTAVLHHHAEITEMAVLVVAETMVMVALLQAEMTGTVVLLPLVLVVEMTEMAGEAVIRRETHGILLLLRPNGGAPRPGHVELPLLRQQKRRIRIVMTVRCPAAVTHRLCPPHFFFFYLQKQHSGVPFRLYLPWTWYQHQHQSQTPFLVLLPHVLRRQRLVRRRDPRQLLDRAPRRRKLTASAASPPWSSL